MGVNLTQFCERYEASIFSLEKLTPHQREKAAEAKRKMEQGQCRRVHITAPAGAGKTFVALDIMYDLLKNHSEKTVLFCVKNRPLALTVAKWMVRRIKREKKGHSGTALRRFHVLFQPFEQGPRTVEIVGGKIQPTTVQELLEFDMVVVDEAHHVWKDSVMKSQVGFRLLRSIARSTYRLAWH